jgi:hypothetical protein
MVCWKIWGFWNSFSYKTVFKTCNIPWGNPYSWAIVWVASWNYKSLLHYFIRKWVSKSSNFPTDHQSFSRAIYFSIEVSNPTTKDELFVFSPPPLRWNKIFISNYFVKMPTVQLYRYPAPYYTFVRVHFGNIGCPRSFVSQMDAMSMKIYFPFVLQESEEVGDNHGKKTADRSWKGKEMDFLGNALWGERLRDFHGKCSV